MLSRAQRHRIQQIARGRSDEGLFLLEGPRAVRDALATPHVAEVWVREDLDPAVRAPLSDVARDAGVALTFGDAPAFARLGDTVTPQGVFALVRDPAVAPGAVLAATGWVLWLDGVQDPGNVGALVRVAAGLGAAGLLVSRGGAHPMGTKALRASAGHALGVPFAVDTPAALAVACRDAARPLWVLRPDGADLFRAPSPERPGVLVIGSEGAGASLEALTTAEAHVAIPMRAGVESLNAAVAGGIALAVLGRLTAESA